VINSCLAGIARDMIAPRLPRPHLGGMVLVVMGQLVLASLVALAVLVSVRSAPGGAQIARIKMTYPRWSAGDGWVKMQQVVNGVNIHYVRNTVTGAVDDFKFVMPR
jgi:hypothetical protein